MYFTTTKEIIYYISVNLTAIGGRFGIQFNSSVNKEVEKYPKLTNFS